VSEVQLDEKSVRAHYERHRETRFKNGDLNQLKDIVARDLRKEERITVVPEYVKRLKSSAEIVRDLKPIHDYYDGIRNK